MSLLVPKATHYLCESYFLNERITFIQAQCSGAAGTACALQAYKRYQGGHTDPWLIRLAQSTVATNH